MIPVSRPSLTSKERALLLSTFDSGQLTYGPCCQEFERCLAQHHGVKHALVTSSGTTALHLALLVAGIGPGDEVLVPDLTFVATANAVRYTGAHPVFVDVHPVTWCIDLESIEHHITHRTRAIVPVHLYGYPCDMTAINDLAYRRDLYVIEDAAEGLGGYHQKRPLGTMGDLGVLSFYANKLITTGEGGAVLTNDPVLANKVYHLRGQSMDPSRRYFHDSVGYNYRMTDLQAAIGLAQLDRFDELLSRRWEVFTAYREHLGNGPFTWPEHPEMASWLFTLLLPEECNRDRVVAALADQGIDTRPTFVPMHKLPYFWGHGDDEFPNATRVGERGLSLPTYPGLSTSDVARICNVLISATEVT